MAANLSDRATNRRPRRRKSQRPAAGPFGPLGRADEPITRARDEARAAVPKTEDSGLARIPRKQRYSKEERRAIVREQQPRLERILERRGFHERAKDDERTAPEILYDESGPETRRQLRLLAKMRAREVVVASTKRRREGIADTTDTVREGGPSKTRAIVKEAGFRLFPPGTAQPKDYAKALLTPPKVAVALSRATVEDPVAVSKSSLRTAKESIAGLPQAAKMLYEHPGRAMEAIAADYVKRYGPIWKDPAKFREQVKKDYGLTPFAADVGGVTGASGRLLAAAAGTERVAKVGGALAKARAPGALRYDPLTQTAAKATRAAGRAARGAHDVANMERPNLRTAPGETGVRRQRTSGNLWGAYAQRTLDRRRAARYEKRKEAAGVTKATGSETVRKAGAEPKRFDALRPGEGEVLPIHGLGPDRLRDLPLVRRYSGRVERELGRRKSALRSGFVASQRKLEKAARKPINRLDKQEKRALRYTMTFGLDPGNMGAAVRILRQRAREIQGERRGADVPAMRNDELRDIHAILKDPEAHITPRVRQSADELRRLEKRTAGSDPDLPSERAAVRRYAEQAQVLGERRRGDVAHYREQLAKIDEKLGVDEASGYAHLGALEPGPRRQAVKSIQRNARKQVRRAERRVRTAERRAARAQGATDVRARILERENTGRATAYTERGAELTAKIDEQKALARQHRRAAVSSQVKGDPAQAKVHKATAARHAREAEKLEHKLETAAPPPVRELKAGALESATKELHAAKAAVDDVKFDQKIADLVGGVKGRSEPAKAFIERVHARAVDAGLRAPAYFESTPGSQLKHSLFAAGSGVRGVAPAKRYTGALYRKGQQSNDPEIAVTGILRNAKRRFSWRFTSNTIREIAFPWSYAEHGGGMTARQIQHYADDHQIDLDSVEFVNPRVLTRHELDTAGLEEDAKVLAPSEGVAPEDVTGIREALEASKVSKTDMVAEANATPRMHGMALNRYLVVPKRHFAELETSMHPDGAFGRSLDVVLRQKPARILLGLANIPWLAFQMASNGMLSGLGRTLNPFDYGAAQTWFRSLTPPERIAIEPYLGITRGMHHASDQTHLAASTNSRIVHAYHAFQKAVTQRKVKGRVSLHDLNPLDAMFRVDEAQNNFFRRSVFYSSAKREAYRRMGASWTSVAGAQKKLLSVLPMRPPKTAAEFEGHMRDIIRNAEEFTQHAEHVRDWLGDYLTYTTAERRTLGRVTMFYGYLRFSLRFAFWTMPVKHPVMAAILSDLGRMGSQEVKRLLGVKPDFDVPMNMLAQMYFGTAERVQEGEGGTLPLNRANPWLNAVTQMERPQQVAGLFSPLIQSEVDQAFHMSSFTGQEWKLSAHEGLDERARNAVGFGSWFSQFHPGSARNKILVRSLLNLAAPYRAAEDVGAPGANLPGVGSVPLLGRPIPPLEGPQFTDTTLFTPRPRTFKDPETRRSIERSIERQRGTSKLRTLFPFLGPLPTSNAQILQNLQEARADAANQRMGRKKKRRSKGSGYSTGGGGYGTGGGGGYSTGGGGGY